MCNRAILGFLVLLGSQSFLLASEEAQLRLRSGAMVVGELLKESAENLVIDLGFTFIQKILEWPVVPIGFIPFAFV